MRRCDIVASAIKEVDREFIIKRDVKHWMIGKQVCEIKGTGELFKQFGDFANNIGVLVNNKYPVEVMTHAHPKTIGEMSIRSSIKDDSQIVSINLSVRLVDDIAVMYDMPVGDIEQLAREDVICIIDMVSGYILDRWDNEMEWYDYLNDYVKSGNRRYVEVFKALDIFPISLRISEAVRNWDPYQQADAIEGTKNTLRHINDIVKSARALIVNSNYPVAISKQSDMYTSISIGYDIIDRSLLVFTFSTELIDLVKEYSDIYPEANCEDGVEIIDVLMSTQEYLERKIKDDISFINYITEEVE